MPCGANFDVNPCDLFDKIFQQKIVVLRIQGTLLPLRTHMNLPSLFMNLHPFLKS